MMGTSLFYRYVLPKTCIWNPTVIAVFITQLYSAYFQQAPRLNYLARPGNFPCDMFLMRCSVNQQKERHSLLRFQTFLCELMCCDKVAVLLTTFNALSEGLNALGCANPPG